MSTQLVPGPKWKTFSGMVVLAIGVAIAGYWIGQGIINFKRGDRIVLIKGIAEREVKSDLAVWSLNFRNSGSDLAQLNTKMTEDRKTILEFLKNSGFAGEEIKKRDTEIIDKLAREYGEQSDTVNRYIFKETFTVRTDKVDSVVQALSNLSAIIEKGVIISGTPTFYYTKFFEIRPEMIGEATQSAQKAALQFAKDSNSKVGSIRTASQGLFSITAKDTSGESSGSSEYSSVEKKIRVVSTVTFNLE